MSHDPSGKHHTHAGNIPDSAATGAGDETLPTMWVSENTIKKLSDLGLAIGLRTVAFRVSRDYCVPLYSADALRAKDAEIERLTKALQTVRLAIVEADPNVLTCTLWMPMPEHPAETVVDFIAAALKEQDHD